MKLTARHLLPGDVWKHPEWVWPGAEHFYVHSFHKRDAGLSFSYRVGDYDDRWYSIHVDNWVELIQPGLERIFFGILPEKAWASVPIHGWMPPD